MITEEITETLEIKDINGWESKVIIQDPDVDEELEAMARRIIYFATMRQYNIKGLLISLRGRINSRIIMLEEKRNSLWDDEIKGRDHNE
jgi:hypothetical protein